jgi:hypothetical protein
VGPVTKKATRTVYSTVPTTKEIEVEVARCVPETKTAMRTVYSTVPVTKEVEVPVTSFNTETREASRTVMVCQPVTEMVNRTFCVMVPHTETIQVPVRVGGYGMSGGFAPNCP